MKHSIEPPAHPNPFNFYKNVIAFSMANPVKGEDIKSDFILEGEPTLLTKGLIEQMIRHKELAVIVVDAAYNYMVENGKPEL